MMKAEQGDILKIASLPYPVVVVSKNFFNESGLAMACPILPEAVRLFCEDRLSVEGDIVSIAE